MLEKFIIILKNKSKESTIQAFFFFFLNIKAKEAGSYNIDPLKSGSNPIAGEKCLYRLGWGPPARNQNLNNEIPQPPDYPYILYISSSLDSIESLKQLMQQSTLLTMSSSSSKKHWGKRSKPHMLPLFIMTYEPIKLGRSDEERRSTKSFTQNRLIWWAHYQLARIAFQVAIGRVWSGWAVW